MSNEKNLILDIQNLSLAFPKRLYQSTSLKDAFVKTLSGTSKKDSNEIHVVLDRISLKVHKGDRIGILAKNGTGKSTLCRCISGYYKPLQGSIERFGTIRALFEASLAIYPELSGRENMEILAGIFYDYDKNEIKKIVDESIVFSGLNEAINAPLKTYSKGMQLRLTLSLLSARAVDLLILDEVFDGADEFFRKRISERVRDLIANSGSVILVSHHESQILEVCNRVIVMKDSRIVFDGDPVKALEFYRFSESELKDLV